MDISDDLGTNPSDNPHLNDIIAASLSRRGALQLGGTAAATVLLAGLAKPALAGASGSSDDGSKKRTKRPKIGFQSVPLTPGDEITVPPGYTSNVLFSWGDPVSNGPAFAFDASQSSADQNVQGGMHHDGIFFYSLPRGSESSNRGLLALNHEYTDQGLLFTDGMVPWTAEKVAKSIAAHGVSVIEVRKRHGKWQVVRPSKYGRRVTGATPCKIIGPAAGSPLMQTAADPTGRTSLGTINNCGSGKSPWGTYVTAEENFNGYFGWDGAYTPTAAQNRYGVTSVGFGYRWFEHDERFNVRLHPNESNRVGWLVDIDPYRPDKAPIKLTACGRFKHETATFGETKDGRTVVYSGDDERNNYVYKFVAKHPWKKALKMGKHPLEEGMLYVGKFNAGDVVGDEMGTGEWVALHPSTPALAHMTLDEILVHARIAGDLVGATKMDRPEWLTVAPDNRVYVTLSNNSRRGRTTPYSASENPFSVADEANPRAASGNQGSPYGHVVRWRENGDQDATTFTWDIFLLAGDPANPGNLDGYKPGGSLNGDMFGSPDGIWADDDGRIWVQTDIASSQLGLGPYANIAKNVMVCADPETREVRRFLVGPIFAEVTGVHTTPDGKTMFVDIQHPGEPPNDTGFTPPATPRLNSNWPDHRPDGRPRSSTLVITKDDGGVIGT